VKKSKQELAEVELLDTMLTRLVELLEKRDSHSARMGKTHTDLVFTSMTNNLTVSQKRLTSF